jgi:hypothetical protein
MSTARILALAALALHAAARAAAPAPATAPNCALAAPPAQAGVDRHLGVLLKVYPRNPDIGADYTGCQTLWAQAIDGWETITVVHYLGGRVVRVQNPSVAGDPVEQCLVRNGVVVRGDPALCAQLDDMRVESLPADCLDTDAGGAGPEAHCVRR